jgi:hypothetical protein
MKRRDLLVWGTTVPAGYVWWQSGAMPAAKAEEPPARWEHIVVDVEVSPGLRNLVKTLDQAAVDGWEVVAILGAEGQTVVLRRQMIRV